MEEKIDLECTVDQLKTSGHAVRRDLTAQERFARAAKTLGICWAIALVTVLIPVLHFILVPGFIVLGIGLGISVWLGKGEVLSGEYACPNCGKINLIPRETESWPLQRRCEGCSFTLTIRPQNSPSV